MCLEIASEADMAIILNTTVTTQNVRSPILLQHFFPNFRNLKGEFNPVNNW